MAKVERKALSPEFESRDGEVFSCSSLLKKAAGKQMGILGGDESQNFEILDEVLKNSFLT